MLVFSFEADVPHRVLHSFPTRRSSDLFTLTVSNSGVGDAKGATLSDLLPTNAGLAWHITSQGPGWGGSCAISAGMLSCGPDRKSTRLNSSHMSISYAVFCLKKKKH